MPEKKIKTNDNVINILQNFDSNGKKKGNKNTKDMEEIISHILFTKKL